APAACDLSETYGTIDAADIAAAIDMVLGNLSCTANVVAPNVCDVVVVQRVVNASLAGGSCVPGASPSGPSVSLNLSVSQSPNLVTYKIYRGSKSGGPYTLLASPGLATTYTDTGAVAGQTYYYVATAADSNAESAYSNEATAVVPSP